MAVRALSVVSNAGKDNFSVFFIVSYASRSLVGVINMHNTEWSQAAEFRFITKVIKFLEIHFKTNVFSSSSSNLRKN